MSRRQRKKRILVGLPLPVVVHLRHVAPRGLLHEPTAAVTEAQPKPLPHHATLADPALRRSHVFYLIRNTYIIS